MIHFYAKTFRIFFYLLPLLYLENVTAQTPTNCPTSYEIFPTNDFTGTLPPYRFYHANGTHSNTFYKDEVIYSIAPTTNGNCLSPTAAVFRTPQVPSSFSALCTGVRVAQFYLASSSAAGGPNCESMITLRTCQKVGPTQWFGSFYQKFQATESGTYNITFDNSTGTTVTINVLERFCVQTDCQNFSGEYIEKGIRNGHTYYADSDNNELFYDETSAAWVIGNSTGNPFKVVSTSATVPTSGWVPAEGEAGVGFTVNVSAGGCIDNPENYSVSYPTYYKPTVKVISSCIPAVDGDYIQTSFVDGKPRFSSSSGATIYFSQSAWFVKPPTGEHFLRTASLAALPPSDACWHPFIGTSSTCTSAPNIVTTTLTSELVNPQKICVRTDCGNFGGIYTQTTIVNQRPNLYDEFNNRIFYFGAGNPAQPEGWYVSNSAGKNVYYNSATTETIPTSNWQVFTVDGITCSSNIGVFDTECPPCPSISASISYGSTLCKSLTESTVTLTGTTGGTFSSTQGLSIDANSGTINPSTSTAGTYTVTYTIVGTNGCANTTTTTSVTIEHSKTPSVVLAANPSVSITAGTNVTFTATPTNGGTTPSYVWKKNDTVIPNETGATYTTNTLVDGDKIKVEMTSNDACASPATATSNEVTMTVNTCTFTPSNITVTYVGGGILGFSGPPQAPAIYTPNGSFNNAPRWSNQFGYIIRWANNRWEIVNESDLNFVIAYNSSGSISNIPCASTNWVVDEEYGGGITLGGGCGSLAPQTVTPSVALAADPSGSITAGTSVTFTATPTNGGTSPSYVWKKNDAIIPNETGATYATNTLVDGDKIKVEMTSNDGCASPVMATSNEITMTVINPCQNITNRIYVTPTGTGNGSSWENATNDLQAAIDNTCGVTEIWVAAGTYIPQKDPFGNTNPTDPRDKTFMLKDGIKIYGGFVGTESELSQRNPATNITILSGDIGTLNDPSDNCYHVAISILDGAGTVLDGFTITKGTTSANFSSRITIEGYLVYKSTGAGLNIQESTINVNNCIIDDNSGNYGGGVYVYMDAASPVISNCHFINNKPIGSNATGLGLNLEGYGDAEISITNCDFASNTGAKEGGAIYLFLMGSSTNNANFIGCNFSGNTAELGGAVYSPSYGDNNVNFIGCTFSNNIAQRGGAAYQDAGDDFSFTNCLFVGNQSTDKGGALYLNAGTSTITNSTIYGNFTTSTTENSGAIYAPNGLTMGNSILWNNTSAAGGTQQQIDFGTSTPNITYSTIQGSTIMSGTGNSNTDPLFSNIADLDGTDNTFGTTDDGLALGVCSPAINTGDNTLITSTLDLVQNTRIQNTTVDRGAYESANSPVITTPTVTIAANPSGSITAGTSVTFTATPTNGGTNPIYVWKKNNVTILNETGATYTSTSLANDDKIKVEMTSNDACASPATATSNEITMVVTTPCNVASPTINAPTTKVVCSPNTLTLTATGCAGTITWSNGSSGTSLTLSNTGTYAVSATCTVNDCVSDASMEVTGLEIKAKPNAPIVNAPANKIVCSPSTLTLSASCSLGTIEWSNGDKGTSITLSNTGTYSITAICTTIPTNAPNISNIVFAVTPNITGCTSDPSTAINGLEIKAKPNAPTINAPSGKVVCFPNALALTATGCNGTVTWSDNSTGTSLMLTNVGTYSLSANCTENGCVSETSTITELEIKAQPKIPVIVAEPQMCLGDTNYLYIRNYDYERWYHDVTFNWSDGRSVTNFTFLLVSPTTTQTYTVSATIDGCTSELSDEFTLTVNQLPNAPTIVANNSSICKGESALLTGTCSSFTESFHWATPQFDNLTNNALPYTNSRLVTEPGTYRGVCISDKGCHSSETSIIIEQSSNCSSNSFIVIKPEKNTICPGASITLTSQGCNGTVIWTGGNTPQTGTSATFSPTTPTTYVATCSTGGVGSIDIKIAQANTIVNNDVASGKEFIKAVNTVESSKKIGTKVFTPGASVIYEAGNAIILKPGFVVETWSTFTAQISGCN